MKPAQMAGHSLKPPYHGAMDFSHCSPPVRGKQAKEVCGLARQVENSQASKPARHGRPTFNANPVKRPRKEPVVYFAQAANGLIKIGTTGFIDERMKILAGQSPVAITLLATVQGARADEFVYHARFAAHRRHGEWFEPHPDILAEIARLNNAGYRCRRAAA